MGSNGFVWTWGESNLVLVQWLVLRKLNMHNALVATYMLLSTMRHPFQHCSMHKTTTLRACWVFPFWSTHVCVRRSSVLSTNPNEKQKPHNLSRSFQTRTVRNNQMTNQTPAWEMKGFGAFHKWGYPQIIHFHGIFHYTPTILDTPIYANPHFFDPERIY